MVIKPLLLVATLCMASASDDYQVSLPSPDDGMTDFEYLLSMGMDDQLASELIEAGAHGAPDSFKISNEIDHAMGICGRFVNRGGGDDYDDTQREDFYRGLCGGIEALLGDSVTCTCSPQLLEGSIFYECDSTKDVNLNNLTIFTPNFFGGVTYRLFASLYIFYAGYCLDDFTVSIPDNGETTASFRYLGDMCLRVAYSIAVEIDPPTIVTSIHSCTFLAGVYGVCELCEGCTTSDGEPGISVQCTFLPVATCTPLVIPRSRASEPLDFTELVGWMNFSHYDV